ncbi:MAG: hypothetical protein B7Y07_05070 [Halothiobacillus sp. 24-54-40]|nr:MAG: hypothetical protein B7Y07_05070 [Halothiobacillus sp. 24-54-40]
MKPRNPLRRLLLLLFWLVLAAFLAVQAWFFVQVWQLRSHNPQTTAFMRERLALVRAVNPHAQLNYQWVNYRDMAPIAKRAVVASEDDRFMDHLGFDWTGIQEAFEKNLADGEFAAGGSTISQQLARNLFLSPSKNLLRKGRYYFHKPPSALSPHEAAMLAAMLPNPRFYQANPASRGLQKRIRAVESRMNASRIP